MKIMTIIDGRSLAEKICKQVKEEIKSLGLIPGLAVILVGDDPASRLYISLKEKACQEVGIKFEKYFFQGGEPEEQIFEKIRELNNRADIHGILVQIPVPPFYRQDFIISEIDPSKDVDGFHQVNLRALLNDEPRIIPPVAQGILELVLATREPLLGKKAVLVVNSTIFATPLEYLVDKHGVLVHIILAPKEFTSEIIAQIRSADIVVVALGRPQVIKEGMLQDGAIVVDVGANRLPDGRLVGDVDLDSTKNKPGYITPVPGGVGPMTVAMLLKNTLQLAQKAK